MSIRLYTRAEFRDIVRRDLGIIPPIDVPGSGAPPGSQPENSPKPTNQEINQALLNAISDCNREAGFHVLSFEVPVAAPISGVRGPYQIDLSNLSPNTYGTLVTPTALITDVKRVLWYNGTVSDNTVPIILQPVFRDTMDRMGNSNYYAQPSSAPRSWYVEGYSLYITPAHTSASTYQIICGTGVTGLQCDTDTLDQVPLDYQNIFEYGAVYNLSIAETQDVEWKDRAQAFGSKFAMGIIQFKKFIEGGTGAPSPTMTFASYRGGYGTRRLVR